MSEQNQFQWPDELWPLADVTNWIVSTSRNVSNFSGPTHIYNAKAWGVTAAFLLDDEEVVFKGCKLPLFEKRVETEEVLARHVPTLIPELLGTKRFPTGETWTLHRSFSAPDVEASGEFENILGMARTLAQLQAKVAKLPEAETATLNPAPFGNDRNIDPTTIAQIPDMLNHMIQRIEETYLDAWHADDGWWLNEFDLPSNVLEQIIHFRPQVIRWAEELLSGEWPLSIDHLDYNIGNAAVQENGRILIFDWEETAISCPFFSIERLLHDADDFEDDPKIVPRMEGALRLTTNQMAVRNAYLDALPWKSRAERERAFDVAMCLAPIKTAYECEPFNEALGRQDGLPPHAARCFASALHYWQAMAGYHDLNIRTIAKDELFCLSEMGGYSDVYLREFVSKMWETGQCRPEWCFVVVEGGEWVARIVYHTLPTVFGNDTTVTFEFLMIPWDDDDTYLEVGIQLLRTTLKILQKKGITALGRHVWSGIDHPQKMHTLVQSLGMVAQRHKESFHWDISMPLIKGSNRLQFRPLSDVGERAFIQAIQSVTEGTLDRSLQEVLLDHSPTSQAKGLFDACRKDYFFQPAWWQLAFTTQGDLVGLFMLALFHEEGDEGVICYIGVVPEYRGQRFIDDLILQATKVRPEKMVRIIADTDSENFPMINAFQRVGYQSDGTGTDYLGNLVEMLPG
ncbi:MAG: GNAT family N-acetyltransferase [Chloroflexota bacterium]